MHAPIHVVDSPKIDKSEDSEVVVFIDKYITFAFPDQKISRNKQLSKKKMQTYHHSTTCRKKTGVICRFYAP